MRKTHSAHVQADIEKAQPLLNGREFDQWGDTLLQLGPRDPSAVVLRCLAVADGQAEIVPPLDPAEMKSLRGTALEVAYNQLKRLPSTEQKFVLGEMSRLDPEGDSVGSQSRGRLAIIEKVAASHIEAGQARVVATFSSPLL